MNEHSPDWLTVKAAELNLKISKRGTFALRASIALNVVLIVSSLVLIEVREPFAALYGFAELFLIVMACFVAAVATRH